MDITDHGLMMKQGIRRKKQTGEQMKGKGWTVRREAFGDHDGPLAAGHFWRCPFCGQRALLRRSIRLVLDSNPLNHYLSI